jgi:hypothetical protein
VVPGTTHAAPATATSHAATAYLPLLPSLTPRL